MVRWRRKACNPNPVGDRQTSTVSATVIKRKVFSMRSDQRIIHIGRFTAIAIFIGVIGVAAAAAQNPIKEILDRMDAHYKNLSSLHSNITMVKYNAQIGRSDTYEGTTSFLPKTAKRVMYVRVDWMKPAQESMVVIGDEYKLYRPKLGQAIVGKTSATNNSGAAGGALAFIGMSKEQLRANYTVRYVGVESLSGGPSTWHLELTPKTQSSYKTADLWVDTDGMPRQAMVTENNDDSTTVLLSNIQKNVLVKTDAFTLTLPKGTQIIKG